MKTQLTILLAFAACIAAADTFDREVPVLFSNTTFTVCYKFTGSSFVPLTSPLGKPHLAADATVKSPEGIVMAYNIPCSFVEGGCWDADPKAVVEAALNKPGNHKAMELTIVLTNGFPTWRTSTQWQSAGVISISNRPQPATFEPRGSGKTTNIIVSHDYHGTITLGTNHINTLVTSGKFCEVRGHVWQPFLSTEAFYLSSAPRGRACGNCKLIQTQTVGEWR